MGICKKIKFVLSLLHNNKDNIFPYRNIQVWALPKSHTIH